MDIALVIFAWIIVAIGLLTISQATLGVSLIALACFLGIMARIAQAERHNKKNDPMADVRKHIERGIK
ncbi:MAG: hypothetical protein WBC74_04565 [Candidatus Omnitrophota bacterium]